MSLDYPILPICQTAESFRNILSTMGPYRDSISLKKKPLLGLYTGSEAQLDLASVRYHALGAYAKSVYLVCLVNLVRAIFIQSISILENGFARIIFLLPFHLISSNSYIPYLILETVEIAKTAGFNNHLSFPDCTFFSIFTGY